MSDIQTITHSKSGASFKVHPFGATVISYKGADGRENLFVSRDAKLDGSKAIRGGIPLVFPIFGPPKDGSGSTMPQHGFARNNVWTVKPGSTHDEESHAGVALTLDLADAKAGRGENNPWSEAQAKTDGTACRLTMDIKVDATSLTTNLVVENTGTDGFDFNMLQVGRALCQCLALYSGVFVPRMVSLTCTNEDKQTAPKPIPILIH